MAATFESLVQLTTKSAILAKGLAVAEAVGLPVTSWAPADPTRSLYHYLAEILETLEGIVGPYVAAAVLEKSSGDWLKILASERFGVAVDEATYATADVTLTNSGGGLYEIAVGDLTFKNATSGKTYHNITGGTLSPGPGTTLELEVEADEAGADSSAAVGEIDDLVTTLLGVTVTNTTAAVGRDAESDESIRQRCREALGALSPNGPRDAYVYVAKSSNLTGATNVTRARSIGDSSTGRVRLYVASPSGAVSASDLEAVREAVTRYALPLTVTLELNNASPVSVDITYTLWIYASVGLDAATIEEEVEDALLAMARVRPIGGDKVAENSLGKLHRSLISDTIRSVHPAHTFRVEVTTPSVDTELLEGQVATIGTINATINIVQDP